MFRSRRSGLAYIGGVDFGFWYMTKGHGRSSVGFGVLMAIVGEQEEEIVVDRMVEQNY